TAPYRIGVDAATEVVEVLVLGADGVAGAPGGGTQVVGPEFLGLFCVTGSCECPQGPALGAVEIPPGGPIGLGLTTHETTGAGPRDISIQVSALTLTEACG